ncbi:FapA family protein [Vibrio ziniensis]|uniref:DUF342 domain-containing protein n=1 Tax=Vibrio ziniensis TaxID=2711221 RepID=A0A6G7CNS4_9VIBR|nr:FapA family protein [Vibrio ziniensis]QIH43678.1 DUF342 domain-containing protein [Vibrio ziniensis]
MWKDVITLTDDKTRVVAKLTDEQFVKKEFTNDSLVNALQHLGASKFFLMEDAVTRFINCASERKGEAYEGIVVAEIRNANVEVILSENDMIASMVVTGAYGGRGLQSGEIIQSLADANVIKGINKAALKKVFVISNRLAGGEIFTQPVAQGKEAINGKDAKFLPLVEDINKRILAPQSAKGQDKIDMRDLGETITVSENDPLMRRQPATKGEPGFTVQGKIILPKPGVDVALVAGKGTRISPTNPNLLLASINGMPVFRNKTIDVENAICLNNVSVATGHVKFKGNVVITGDVEPGMIVRATGSVTVGGFIESADVQAQGNIEVGKGIIGHTATEGEEKSCTVKSGSTIKANYAQYAELQAGEDIYLTVHSMGNVIRCGKDLTVLDDQQKQGTLSGGTAKVGGKVVCLNLGVEGDTITLVEAFASFGRYKERIANHRDQYKQAQEGTMDAIRKELEFKKRPKAERSAEEELEINDRKEKANERLEKVKSSLDLLNEEFELALAANTVEAKNKVFTHVTVQFSDEKVVTKRVRGPSVFAFNQYEIQVSSKLEDEDVGV